MPTRVLVLSFDTNSITGMRVIFAYTDNTNFPSLGSHAVNISVSSAASAQDFQDAAVTAINADAVTNGYTLSDGIIWLTSIPSLARSFSNPTRALDTAYQPSASRDALGIWSVSVASNLSLTGGQLGSIQLQYADDSGFTTNVVTLSEVQNGNTGTLTIGLNTVQTQGAIVTGVIPAGKYFRLHAVDTTGAPTQSFVRAQEVLL